MPENLVISSVVWVYGQSYTYFVSFGAVLRRVVSWHIQCNDWSVTGVLGVDQQTLKMNEWWNHNLTKRTSRLLPYIYSVSRASCGKYICIVTLFMFQDGTTVNIWWLRTV